MQREHDAFAQRNAVSTESPSRTRILLSITSRSTTASMV